jgi:hypothetical protein
MRVVVQVSRKTLYNRCRVKRHQPRRTIQLRVGGTAQRTAAVAVMTSTPLINPISLANRYSSPTSATVSAISVRHRHANVIGPGRR